MSTSIENLKIFFSPSYLLNPYPTPDMNFMIALLIFFSVLIILSGVVFLSARKERKKPIFSIFVRIYNWFFWIGIIGIFLLFFRYEGIPFLSMRLLLMVWILIFAIWGMSILWFRLKRYKKIVKDFKDKVEKEKYFRKK